MKQFTAAAAVLVMLLPTLAQGGPMDTNDADKPVGGSAFHKNDITYSTAVATPHIAWATKLPGGPIRGFFIPSVEFGRDMVELMQRLDLQPTTVTIDRNWDTNCWGIGDYYDHENRGDRDDFRIEYGYVERDLTGPAPFDVMVIPGLNGWTRMTRPARDAILRRVKEGAGLVLIHPFLGDVEHHPFAGDEKTGDTRLWDISPLVGCPNDTIEEGSYPLVNKDAIATGKWEAAQDHYITRGVPLALLPEAVVGGQFYKYRAAGDLLIKSGDHPILAVKQYGKGRVVALGYVEDGFLPKAADPIDTRIGWNYWEYEYSLLARAIAWAAGRDSGTSVDSFDVRPDSISLALGARTASAAIAEVSARTAFGQAFPTYRTELKLQAGRNPVDVPLAAVRPATGWPRGKVIFDVIVRDSSGATLDWASSTFEATPQATLAEIKPAAGIPKQGDTLSVAVRMAGQADGLKLRFTVTDDYDRLLARQERPAAARADFSYRLGDFLGKYATAQAELVDAHGFVVDRIETKPIFIARKERREREYAAQIGFSSVRPNFRSVRLRQIRGASVDTGLTWTEGINNGLDVPRGSFGIYWYDRGPEDEAGIEKAIQEYQRTGDYARLPYNAKKVLYNRTHDKKLLVRIPSFCDPGFMSKLRESVYKSAHAKAPYGLDYYFVGDEGSLTSYGDAYDYSWDEYTLASFREWLKTQYASLEALNKEWRTSFKDWDVVVPYTTEEAHQTGDYAPWADHRTFMEVVFAQAYQAVRDAVVKGDPEGHIAVSGTQATTAYNGCDWYRLDQVIDDFLSYGGGNQWDLHRSFAKPGAMIGFWTGYGSHGLGVQNAIWNAAIHDVLYPQIFWLPSFLNPDFTYSKSARDMGEAFHALKYRGIGKLFMESERLQDGIAIHYSMPSVHAAVHLFRQRGGGPEAHSLEADRDGWVRVVNDLGMQFDFVASGQVEKGALSSSKYRVVILPLSTAISAHEAQEIRAFAERGGIVIADAAAGIMDDHCAWIQNGSLSDFFGISAQPSPQRSFGHFAGPVTLTAEGRRWGLAADQLDGLAAVEAVSPSSGTPLVRIGEKDACFVRQVGKGWAIYLNAALDDYSQARGRAYGGAGYRGLMNAMLGHLGIRPAVQVLDADGKSLSQAQIVRYRFGDSEALAIVKENVGLKAIQGRDGVTTYQDANLGEVASEEITVRLPARYHVADILAGKQCGLTDTVKTKILVGGALVLGLTKQPGRVTVNGPSIGRLGDHVPFHVAASGSQRTLLRCHVLGPDGHLIQVYARNLVVAGKGAQFVLPSALNDPPGRYTIQVADVVTGSSAETNVTLK